MCSQTFWSWNPLQTECAIMRLVSDYSEDFQCISDLPEIQLFFRVFHFKTSSSLLLLLFRWKLQHCSAVKLQKSFVVYRKLHLTSQTGLHWSGYIITNEFKFFAKMFLNNFQPKLSSNQPEKKNSQSIASTDESVSCYSTWFSGSDQSATPCWYSTFCSQVVT